MNDPALTKPVKTSLPPPKPNRRKRLALRFAVLVVAVSALGVAYWFSRPPEVVWWRSPPFQKTGRRVMAFVPNGWKLLELGPSEAYPRGYISSYEFKCFDGRPALLRKLFPKETEQAELILSIEFKPFTDSNTTRFCSSPWDLLGFQSGHASVERHDLATAVHLEYQRQNASAFNRTYRQICNSLRIE